MIIAIYNSAEGSEIDSSEVVNRLFAAGTINRSQANTLASTLRGYNTSRLHIEKIGRKLWVTIHTKRRNTWTWSIGPMGKASSPHLDTSAYFMPAASPPWDLFFAENGTKNS
jgi:hypothetical protein